MFEVITKWNLTRPDKGSTPSIKEENRGYHADTFLTGEFARKIHAKEISALSLGTIAGVYCRTRRDLYYEKGVNRPNGLKKIINKETWGRKVGYVVEEYLSSVTHKGKENTPYDKLIKNADTIDKLFKTSATSSINELKNLENTSPGITAGATDWLQILLTHMSRSELGLKLLHKSAKETDSLDVKQIEFKPKLMPNPLEIGINNPAEPDFMIPQWNVIGDIKTGTVFTEYYLLTCAGYALAYENSTKKNMDWGMIYFFPTRNPTKFVKPITFPQIYIFPIDDTLRTWFMDFRDQAYDIIADRDIPDFPIMRERKNCTECRFKDTCLKNGLDLSEFV